MAFHCYHLMPFVNLYKYKQQLPVNISLVIGSEMGSCIWSVRKNTAGVTVGDESWSGSFVNSLADVIRYCHELWLEEPKVDIAYTAQKDQLHTAQRFQIIWLLKDHSWWLFPTNQVWVSTWYMGWCVWTNRNAERWCHSRTWVLYSCPSTLAPNWTLIGLGPLQSLGNLVKT